MTRNSGESGVKSLQVALDVLEAVAFADTNVGVTELANQLGVTKGTVFRHLHTFVERGYVIQDPETSRYRLGIKSHLLSRIASRSIDLLAVSEPIMRALREELGHSVVLSVVEPKVTRVVRTIMGKSSFEIGVRPGSELLFHASAQGRVALAFGPPQLVKSVQKQPLSSLTAHTTTDFTRLWRQLETIRKQGWATAPEETMLGLNAVAAPIFDQQGACLGAVAIVGSIQFIERNPSASQIAAVKRASAQISQDLGFSPEDKKGRRPAA